MGIFDQSFFILSKDKNRGFTLIELLVVIAIIGILASFLVANYVGVRSRGRDAQRKSDLLYIQSALELYRSDSGSYPANLPACGSSLTFSGNTYMRRVPCDPLNTSPHFYRYASAFSNSAYTLATCLENANDSQKDSANNPQRVDGGASLTACAGGTSNWSFTLLSP
jgi:type II secretion system protein G